jgi:hypothetical protein
MYHQTRKISLQQCPEIQDEAVAQTSHREDANNKKWTQQSAQGPSSHMLFDDGNTPNMTRVTD